MYKLFLTLRYLRKRRIAYLAIAAVTLCTAMVLIVMSVMGGFLDVLRQKARGLLGDVIVDNRSYSGFPLYDEFIAEVSAWPEIEKATPVLYSFGLLRFHSSPQTNTVRVVGIRLEEVYRVNTFKSGLFYERHYPGTTTLAEQRMPLIGISSDEDKLRLRDAHGRAVETERPVLPEPFESARQQAWSAGVRDLESPFDDFRGLLASNGVAPVVGEYELTDPLGPPAYGGDPFPGLIFGRDLIARRESDGKYRRYFWLPRGAELSLTLVPVTGGGGLETPIKQPFRYADDSRTGIYEIDSEHVYVDFDLLQRLLRMDGAERVDPESGQVIGRIPPRCSQIQVKLRTHVNGRAVDPHATAQKLQKAYREMADDGRFDLSLSEVRLVREIDGMTWEESQAHYIAPVEKERRLVTTLFGIISLVSGVLVLCILYMIVLQKTRDIGIIKSIGASSAGVAAIFVAYGAAIGVVGAGLGAALGYAFVANINAVQEFLAWAFKFRVWDQSVYSFDRIPDRVNPVEMAVVVIFAIATATLGSLTAAWRAGTMQPVEALRHE